MIARFVPFGAPAPAEALAVDGAVAGALAIYSHWQGDHTTPAELAADTSTGMLVRAAADAERWIAPFPIVCNNHIDADGLLSVVCACRPDLARQYAPVLIAAATAGDFTIWTGEPGYRLVLRLHQLIREQQKIGEGWEQRTLDEVVASVEAIVATDEQPGRDERDAAVTQVTAAISRLIQSPPEIIGRLAVVRWQRQLGHASDTFLSVFQPDDQPLIALSTVIPPTHFQLLIEETTDGIIVDLSAPRHSWARTVDLPLVAWPNLSPLAAELKQREPDVAWTARPGAEAVGFTCLLASRGASRLDPASVIAACANALNSHRI